MEMQSLAIIFKNGVVRNSINVDFNLHFTVQMTVILGTTVSWEIVSKHIANFNNDFRKQLNWQKNIFL